MAVLQDTPSRWRLLIFSNSQKSAMSPGRPPLTPARGRSHFIRLEQLLNEHQRGTTEFYPYPCVHIGQCLPVTGRQRLPVLTESASPP